MTTRKGSSPLHIANSLGRPDAALGLVRAVGVDMGAVPPGFGALLAELVARRGGALTPAEEARRKAVRGLLRNGRYKPTGRGKPASEYLVRAAAEAERDFPRINGPVDVCNYVSLRHLLPISLWDVDRAGTDRFVFRLGASGEAYVFNEGGQSIELEDLVVGCRVWEGGEEEPIVNPVKDSLATKTAENTSHVAAAVYTPLDAVSAEELAGLCAEFAELLAGCGTDVRTDWAVAGLDEAAELEHNAAPVNRAGLPGVARRHRRSGCAAAFRVIHPLRHVLMLTMLVRVALLAAALVWTGCERQAGPPTLAEAGAEETPDHESWDVTFRVSETPSMQDVSVPRLVIEAGYMATFERGDSSFTRMRGRPDSTGGRVTISLFDEAGDTSAVVQSDRVTFFEDDRRFEAYGAVRVRTNEGRTLETEHLRWRERERKVYTDDFVRLTTPTERIEGYRLVADEDLARYRLGRITGQVTIEDG